EIAIGGAYNGHGLTDIADLAHGNAPIVHRVLEPDDQRLGVGADVFAGDDSLDTLQFERLADVDADDPRMRMRRPQEGCVQRSPGGGQIVHELAAATQERPVLYPPYALADISSRACFRGLDHGKSPQLQFIYKLYYISSSCQWPS